MGYQYRGTIRDIEEESTPTPAPRLGVFDPSKCGTYAGYRQHQKYGLMPACRPCKDAQAAYSRDYIERRGGRTAPAIREFQPGACGTYAGYARHLRSEVPPCADCHRAWLEYRRAWRSRKRAA